MMIKRCLLYIGMALAMCMGSFAVQASERLEYLVVQCVGDASYAAESVRHDATLAQWRTGSQTSDSLKPSNLIALSNHFGLASAAPFSVPDWDMRSTV